MFFHIDLLFKEMRVILESSVGHNEEESDISKKNYVIKNREIELSGSC